MTLKLSLFSAMSFVFKRVSLPVLVMRAAMAWAWNLEELRPRQPYILFAVSLRAV
jgi:hypothetical protein